MSSITKLKTAQSVRYFDKSVALNLVQAFHRELDLGRLLELLYSQAQAVVRAVGLHYRNREVEDDVIDLLVADRGRHTASYNLTYAEEKLGELIVHFDTRVTEETLETTEDLIALVMSPIRNALRHRSALLSHPTPQVFADIDAPGAALTPGSDDCLILLKLDGLGQVRQRDGDAWAQTLLQSAHNQIREGLRGADGVFQIDGDTLAIVLPHTPSEPALDVAAKIRILISSLHLKDGVVTQQLTACMGIASTRHASSASEVLDQAREALDDAERKGPNEMVIYRFSSAS